MIIDMILMEPEANNVPYAFAIFVKLQHMETSVMFAQISLFHFCQSGTLLSWVIRFEWCLEKRNGKPTIVIGWVMAWCADIGFAIDL